MEKKSKNLIINIVTILMASGRLTRSQGTPDWVIDRYRVTTDPLSKIVNDPNDSDDPQYIVRLVKKVVKVSVPLRGIMETVKVVKEL
jgi:predicted helicase